MNPVLNKVQFEISYHARDATTC